MNEEGPEERKVHERYGGERAKGAALKKHETRKVNTKGAALKNFSIPWQVAEPAVILVLAAVEFLPVLVALHR